MEWEVDPMLTAGLPTTTTATATVVRAETGLGRPRTRGGGTTPPKRSPGYRRASKSKGMSSLTLL